MENADEIPFVVTVVKYFAHGLLFSILFTALAVVAAVIAVFLVVIGNLIGLLIGIGLLIFLLGFTNAVITDFIWKIHTSATLTSLFQHGFVLFIVLLIVDTIPTIIFNVYFPGTITAIMVFIMSCLIDGFLCRKVAELWEEYSDKESVKDLLARIP